jgi:uncharacterized membrane protein YfbV (UPF0208 family)
LATSDIMPRIAISTIATSSMFNAVGLSPMCSTACIAMRCGPEGTALVGLVSIASIESSMDMPRPSNMLAMVTATSARPVRPG